jgi:CheY-like chemotaxis protein
MFTDYNMPGMNGIELIEKTAARWPKIKFILASGYLDDILRARLDQLNVTVLSKPYDLHSASGIVMQKLAAA